MNELTSIPEAGTSIFDRPEDFYQRGLDMVETGKAAVALGLMRKLAKERPDDGLLGELAGLITTHGVPGFHHGMLFDAPRNAAYRAAIERFAPGKRVLDIGTGSGLLAMMAARAGAAHVVACEANPLIAATAREIIAANGLADRITVHAAHSSQLDRTRDLGGGAELIVSEIFHDNLVGEGVLPSLDHARSDLGVPDAVFLPGRASVRVALVDTTLFEDDGAIGMVEGFDLAPFNRHVSRTRNIGADSQRLRLRSAPVEPFAFDFAAQASLATQRQNICELASDGGHVTGVVQWLRLEFADDIAYENLPGANGPSHWTLRYTPLRCPRDTQAGDMIRIGGWHDARSMVIWEE
ncbi:50S ribosomal protein L11 methyltransferase [Novosphingobium sp.]|uniref:50S ribosomal protein L11 methyltransferase n=1 Tax=Novosphingobium sp. TaxID=1874826 RepID=UPI0025DF3A6D|nr:50S ribosomal protein L11 methyltransferase [Novosphingobium sp.]